jgi:hypothetical protein
VALTRRSHGLSDPLARTSDYLKPLANLPSGSFLRLAIRSAVIFLVAAPLATAWAQQTPQFRTAHPEPVLDPPSAQPSTPTTLGSGAGFTGTEGLTTIPPNSYAFLPEPSPYAPNQFFRNTQFPYGPLLTPPSIGPYANSESITGHFGLNLPGIYGGSPFLTQSGFQPQDADLKLGPFYFKLRELQAAFLYSDNINLTPKPESGEIAFVGMTIQVMAQITDNLRVATEGTFVYLPIQNQAGIAGFGLGDYYNFGLFNGPIVHAQVAWETEIAGWNVVFADDFQVGQGYFSNDFQNNDVLFSGWNTNAQAVAGRYQLRPDQGFFFQNSNNNNRQINFRNDIIVYTNTVSASVDRLLPDSIRLNARIYHENFWYNQGNRGQPDLRQDGAIIGLYSERENLRFKPYFIYEAFNSNEFSGVQSIFRLGVSGPITDQLHLLAEGGYYTGGIQNDSGALWHIELDHVAGPYTQESIIWAREFNYFNNEIDDVIGLNFYQILGPKLDMAAYAYRVLSEYSFGDGSQATSDQWRLGVRFDYNLGPKTWLRLFGQYASSNPGSIVWWSGRAQVDYLFSDTIRLQLIYQYQQNNSSFLGQNYKENLIFISLTKFFP